MTKIVTATAVMQLVEQGRLDLDGAVRPLVREFSAERESTPVTVRDLLSHSAGLANPPPVRSIHPAGAFAPGAADFVTSSGRSG